MDCFLSGSAQAEIAVVSRKRDQAIGENITRASEGLSPQKENNPVIPLVAASETGGAQTLRLYEEGGCRAVTSPQGEKSYKKAL